MYAKKKFIAAPDGIKAGFPETKGRFLNLLAVGKANPTGQMSYLTSDVEDLVDSHDRPIACVIEAFSP